MNLVEHIPVAADETGMRLDRWFKVHFPGLGFGQLQKLLRSGQIRVDGGRVKSDTRLSPGQSVRIPPSVTALKSAPGSIAGKPVTARTMKGRATPRCCAPCCCYEDKKVFVFNKPAGLAVQGGSGLVRHVDACWKR